MITTPLAEEKKSIKNLELLAPSLFIFELYTSLWKEKFRFIVLEKKETAYVLMIQSMIRLAYFPARNSVPKTFPQRIHMHVALFIKLLKRSIFWKNGKS